MLTGPFYMLQIYDRVLTTRNTDTLLVLTGIVLLALLVLGILDAARSAFDMVIQVQVDPCRHWGPPKEFWPRTDLHQKPFLQPVGQVGASWASRRGKKK